ncbi:MAG: cobyric acid synthase [Oscillospiraceae bacterium]|nr:cobyric acid synthase [Oscillospiraceae bacterium]
MAKSIMIQGTSSGAGKSLLTAGLCRALLRRGYRAAPFKSQNMSLNSFVTPEGHEIGRAQAMQAEAARIFPSVYMNPVLLKPLGDSGSQVVVGGEALGVMSAREYFGYKKKLLPVIEAAYRALEEDFDVIVIEGAGSPAEINLRENDIVNMGLAALVGAPVLIVGDIDRGGVFASLYGTLELLEPQERALVRGFVINKFRGDLSLLKPGLDFLKEKTGVPPLGVLPFLGVDLEDEDSLAPRLNNKSGPAILDIAVIRFPHISNFTDLHALEQIKGVSVRYVSSPAELGSPDLVILPGTKNTIGDLNWLRRISLDGPVKALARAKLPVIGICGGYQMLGAFISDPSSVEGGGAAEGLGLLPVSTRLLPQKSLAQVAGSVRESAGFFKQLSNKPLRGYEIHAGATRTEGVPPFADIEGRPDGAVSGNVLGTYVHGLFDSAAFTGALCELLLRHKGLPEDALRAVDYPEYKERQYELLADALEAHLDMDRIMAVIENG